MDQSFYELGIDKDQIRYDELTRVEDAARLTMADIDVDEDVDQ
jgi:hypothetical protein